MMETENKQPDKLAFDWESFWNSCKEVGYLTLLALLPLIINIGLAAISLKSVSCALTTKIIPGEILSYCLGFLAPSMYLLTKTQGSGYKLPFVHLFSGITLLIYVLIMVFYLVAKNKWVDGINMDQHRIDPYYIMAIIFFFLTLIFRIYSVYHSKEASSYFSDRKNKQAKFNSQFKGSITE